MNITLTPELEQLVQTKVDGGEYESADGFIREAAQAHEFDETALHTLAKGIRDCGLKRLTAERENAGVRG